jgi:hypothetical protein
MFYDCLDEPWQGWRRYRRCRTKRGYNHVHDNENAKSLQERTNDNMAAQERNALSGQDENTSDNKRYD